MLIISHILLAAFLCIMFLVSIFNAGENRNITAVMLAISEIIQQYSLDCDS